MVNIWAYFHNMASWMVPIVLGLLTAGIVIPFHCIMSAAGPSRKAPLLFFIFINPLIEEIAFRLVLLGFLTSMFSFTPAVIIMSVIYSLFMALLYGTPSMADGLILGIFLSFAMLEFGFPVVVIAHIIYRLIVAT